jgi:acyl-homoserine lactone acylase PvdQ
VLLFSCHRTGYKPDPWRVADSLALSRLMGSQLTFGALRRLVYARIVRAVGPARAVALGLFAPGTDIAAVGVALCVRVWVVLMKLVIMPNGLL